MSTDPKSNACADHGDEFVYLENGIWHCAMCEEEAIERATDADWIGDDKY